MTPELAPVPLLRLGPLRFESQRGAPLGLILAAVGACGALVARFVDRLPFVLCSFKRLTGLPCPTCGATRCAGALGRFDLASAFAANPLVFGLGVVVLAWAVVDAFLWRQGRTLGLSVGGRGSKALGLLLLGLVAANWIYLILAGR